MPTQAAPRNMSIQKALATIAPMTKPRVNASVPHQSPISSALPFVGRSFVEQFLNRFKHALALGVPQHRVMQRQERRPRET
jgi:hypothetical protein